MPLACVGPYEENCHATTHDHDASGSRRAHGLVMAMLALLILSALIIGFSTLSSTEPVIASNQLHVAQARSLAESGVERAIWALTKGKLTPGATGSLAYPLPGIVPPYDSSQLFTVSAGGNAIGGFRVTVSQPAAPNERNIVAVGWVPDDGVNTPAKTPRISDGDGFRVQSAHRRAPSGAASDRRRSNIDSTWDTSCGNRYGRGRGWSIRAAMSSHRVTLPSAERQGLGRRGRQHHGQPDHRRCTQQSSSASTAKPSRTRTSTP
jgi:hypothetical protein